VTAGTQKVNRVEAGAVKPHSSPIDLESRYPFG
jgi:hypothetical protein